MPESPDNTVTDNAARSRYELAAGDAVAFIEHVGEGDAVAFVHTARFVRIAFKNTFIGRRWFIQISALSTLDGSIEDYHGYNG